MPKEKNTWFTSWFNTSYYHILYKERNHREAALFMNNLTKQLLLAPGSEILDLACGKGRHSKFLYRKGFDVTGVDISEQSIAHAKAYERPRLHFEVHDMRFPYHKKFDAVFNLFTSFGYFPDERDNYRTIKTIKSALKPEGVGVIDFMNSKLALNNLVEKETKLISGITFNIHRYLDEDFIVKEITFEHQGKTQRFIERVRTLTLDDFLAYFEEVGITLTRVFGDYHLNDYDSEQSERLILLLKR